MFSLTKVQPFNMKTDIAFHYIQITDRQTLMSLSIRFSFLRLIVNPFYRKLVFFYNAQYCSYYN